MSSEKKRGSTKTLGGIILGGAALFGFLNDGTDFLGKILDKNPFKEATQQQNEITEKTIKFSNSEINKFMKDYNFASVSALNHKEFAEVEDYLDPTGTMYKTQQKYIADSSITQENPKTVIGDVTEVSSNIYKVSTYEEYDIYRKGNKETTDKHYHQYTLIVDNSNKLKVSEHTVLKYKPW